MSPLRSFRIKLHLTWTYTHATDIAAPRCICESDSIGPMDAKSSNRGLALVYAGTIFTSAFLLFQIQPMISKAILPWFGGTPAVWTVCLLFFQSLLFAGYAYAHFTSAWLRP